MVQRNLFNLYLARTAGMLSGARRVAVVLLMMLLTMTAQTAWAQEHPLPDPDSDGNVTLDGGEYIVSSNVTISGNITANGPVNLTISSGATLTVGGMGPKQIQMEGGTINVEGGTISGQDCNINVNTFNMNGGSVNVNGLLFHFGTIQNNATIEAYSVNMTGIIDKISITGSTIDSNVINADNVTFSGSDVTVGIYLQLSGPVVFDASSPGVSINIAEYKNNGGSLTISNGSLKDGDGNIYTGAIADPSALNGKTLTYYNPSSAITVSLNAQGGSGGTGSVTPTADEDMPTITPPTRTGYTFGGYYTEQNGGGTQYYDADGTSAHVCELTGTVTLYAKWTANDYTVTLDRQGGSGQESVTATFGSAMPALNPVPSRTDCEFFGYYTETNGGGTKYYNADGTSARTWGIDANTTLYAYWKKSLANADITVEIPAQTYNGSELTPVVTVKDGGAEVSDAHYDIILPEGRTNAGDYTIYIEAKEGSTAYVRVTQATFTINRRTVTLTSATDSKPYDGNALTNDGVTVGGDGFADGEGATYNVTGSQTDAGSSNNTFTYTLNDGTLDANYNITTVEGMLTITKAASSVTAAPTARSLVYDGSEQTLIDAGTASGGTMYYSLDNSTWSTGLPTATEAGEYTVYYKVEGDGNHNNTDAASIKAYIDYTITYDLDGGSVASANPTRYNETTATFTLTNPTRTGYDFTGWTGTGLIYPEMEVTIPEGSAGNRSYTATWETINFEENDITYEWTGSGTNLLVAGYNGNSASLDIPKSVDHNGVSYTVTEIGKEAFENNSTLTSIDISSNSNPITIIGARAFKNCTNLSVIHFPDCVTIIEDETFSGCALTEFTIPETVTSIGQRAFADCPSLTSVTIPETETIWGENPFEGCSENLIIYVPEHLVDTYRSLWPDANILAVGTIPYIAADGSKAICTEGTYTVLTGDETSLGTDGTKTWYVVNSISDINYDHTITLNGKVNIILADGKTMNIGSSEAKISGYGLRGNANATLTVYGQSEGTGNLNIYATYTPDGNLKHEGHGIYLNNTYTQYGGEVTIDGTSNDDNPGAVGIYASNIAISGGVLTINSSKQSDCIHATGTFTISGGTVNTTKNNGISINIQVIGDMTVSGGTLYATSNGGTVICGNSNIYLNGGTVTANNSGAAGYGIRGNVTLGGGTLTTSSFDTWNNASSVTIASGFAYTNGEIVYNSATPSATLAALTDVTLTPKKDFTLCTATVPDQLLGSYTKIMYKFEAANSPSNGIIIGESVKDGETTLTLGTDYEFGSVSYQDPDADPSYALNSDDDKPGDECLVEIRGKGDYAGTKTVPFTIISPSGNGTWGDLSWSVENGTLSISGTGAMNAAAKYDGYPWYTYSSIITSVTIGEGITSVADYAFAGTYNMNYYGSVETVSLPSTLTSIGDNAFAFCTGATITIPSSSNVTYGTTPFNQVKCVVGTLSESADNTALIDLMSVAQTANVTLSGRTLKKDGSWNTLCLPFSLSAEQIADSPLAGATIMEMNDAVDGTSFDITNGEMTLRFKAATSIEEGMPYIVKWASGDNITDPVFTGVKINADAPEVVTSNGGSVTFKGSYSPYTNNVEVLLKESTGATATNAFHAFVKVNDQTSYAVEGVYEDAEFQTPASTLKALDENNAMTYYVKTEASAPVEIAYVDENGATQTVDAIVLDPSRTSLVAGTYVVNDDITFANTVTLEGDVTLILADGGSMTIGSSSTPLAYNGIVCDGDRNHNLTIYGQSEQTGSMKLYVNNYNGYAIAAKDIAIYGGKVAARNNGYGYGISGKNIRVKANDVDAHGGTNAIFSDGILDISGCQSLRATLKDDVADYSIKAGDVTISDGRVTVNGQKGLHCSSLDISGGEVNVVCANPSTSGIYHCVYVIGDATISGGQVNVSSTEGATYYIGIGGTTGANGTKVTVSGGQVTVTTANTSTNDYYKCIDAATTISFTDATDFIKADSYGSVTIADGTTLTDGTVVYYSGDLNNDQKNAVAGEKLQPITGVTLTKDGSGNVTATLDPTSEDEVSIPVAVEVNHIEVERNYEANKASTVYLPFSIALGNVSGGTFNKFTGVDESTTPLWTVKYEEVTSLVDGGMILANTPYIFLPAGGKITVNNGNTPITVGTKIASTPQTATGWEFIGTHKRIKWTHNTTDPEYTSERENEIGSIYGFAAEEKSGAQVGQFVKVGNNVWINPMRAYLKRSTPSAARGATRSEVLPDKMRVVIVKASGETTEIGTLDTRTGEISLDEWYSLDGHKLSGKPSVKGIYIHDGKTVVVK